MNIVGYIKKFGKYSFDEMPFNDVDATVLATSIYANFEVFAPSFYDTRNKEIMFKDIFSVDLVVVTAGKTFMKGIKKLIPEIKKSKRFGSIGIKYVYKIYNEELANQFYACTFIIPEIGTYICFRGTDVSTIGWQEDLNLAIKDVVISQLDALDYLEAIASRTDGPLLVGGHSKGGNLALYSILNCSDRTRERLVNLYLLDSNGLKNDNYYSSNEYKMIANKIKLFCPYNTVVSTIMNNPKNRIILKSSSFYIFQHNPHSWKVDSKTGDFIHLKKLKKAAYLRISFFKGFINELNIKDKENFISFFIKIMGGASTMLTMSFKKFILGITYWIESDKAFKESIKRTIAIFIKSKKLAKIENVSEQDKINEKQAIDIK